MASRSDLDLALRIRADAKQAKQELGSLASNLDATRQTANALAAAIRGVTVGLAAGFSIAEITKASDAWTDFNNRLRLVTDGQAKLSAASMDVYRIAQATSQELMGTATVYQRFAQQAELLGLNQQRLAGLTETVSKAIAISGSSASSASAALVQFGQGLASGVLRGEEFNSVAEQAPGLLQALATGLGVTAGQLRKMANDGKLTTDVLVGALEAAKASVDEQFATRVKTISAAVVELDNAFTRLVGTLSTGQGAGTGIAGAISGLAGALDGLSNNAQMLGTALDVALTLAAGRALSAITGLTAGAIKAVAAKQAAAGAALMVARAEAAEAAATLANAQAKTGLMTGTVSATVAATAHAAAQTRLATAQTASAAATIGLSTALTGAVAVGGRILGFLGGPVGLIATLGLTAWAFLDVGNNANQGMEKAAGATESAAKRVRNATSQIIGDLKIGALDKASYDQITNGLEMLKERLKEAESIRDRAQTITDSDVPLVPGVSAPNLKEAEERVQALNAAIKKLEAEHGGKRFENVKAGNEYLEQLKKQYQQTQNLSHIEEARLLLKKKNIAEDSELGKKIVQQAKDFDALEAHLKSTAEAEKASAKAARDAAREVEQRREQQQSYVSGLERQAATLGMNAQQLRVYELAEKALTGTLKQRAEAAIAAQDAFEKQQQALENADTNAGLEADYLSAIGRETDAAMLEIDTKYKRLLRDFEKTGNTTGAAWAEKLVDVEKVKARLDAVQAEIDKGQSAISRAESRINVEREAGLITQTEAQQKLLALRAAEIKLIEDQLPKLRDLAAQGGAAGEQAQVQLDGYQTRLIELKNTTTDLQHAFKEGLTSGLNEAISGLADGTMSLRDALTALVLSVADALSKLAAQQLADQLWSGVSSLLNVQPSGATEAAGAIAYSTAISTSSASGAGQMALAITTAGAQAAAAMASAISGSAVASSASGAATGGVTQGLFSGLADWWGGFAFAEGGKVVGPGTGTSDSILARLSNNEFVVRSASVKQPGAEDFLHDFNRYGMGALNRVRHATGGLAGIPAPAMPAPSLSGLQLADPSRAMSTTVKNAINLHVVQDESAIAGMAWGRAGQEHYKVYLQRNAAEIRSILKL